MRLIYCFILGLVSLASACSQGYKPHVGETVLKLSVESRGDVYIKLFTAEAPKTTDHIEKLVKSNFYDGLRFHRVDKTPKPFLALIGDPQSKSGDLSSGQLGGSGTTVPYENTGHANVEGAVGLARAVGNQNSGDSQFYILLGPSTFLDGNYTVFGQVVSGMDVVKQLEKGDRLKSATIITG